MQLNLVNKNTKGCFKSSQPEPLFKKIWSNDKKSDFCGEKSFLVRLRTFQHPIRKQMNLKVTEGWKLYSHIGSVFETQWKGQDIECWFSRQTEASCRYWCSTIFPSGLMPESAINGPETVCVNINFKNNLLIIFLSAKNENWIVNITWYLCSNLPHFYVENLWNRIIVFAVIKITLVFLQDIISPLSMHNSQDQ